MSQYVDTPAHSIPDARLIVDSDPIYDRLINKVTAQELDEQKNVNQGIPELNAITLKHLCLKDGGYEDPELNDKIYAHFRGFRKIEGLESYVNVKTLFLESNGISKIENLAHLTQLRGLTLHQNLIGRMENLAGLQSLVSLNLAQNNIEKIEGLACLPNLATFNISKNRLVDEDSVSELESCSSISNLDISTNKLNDVTVLDVLGKMPALVWLKLEGNPFVGEVKNYRKTVICKVPKLCFLERPVFEMERKSAEAWQVGGREAEVEARHQCLNAEKDKDKENMAKYRAWKKKIQEDKIEELKAAGKWPPPEKAKTGGTGDPFHIQNEAPPPLESIGWDQAAKATGKGQNAIERSMEARARAAAIEDVTDIEPIQAPEQADPHFCAAPAFQGARPGLVFKNGGQGVGYYTDKSKSKEDLSDLEPIVESSASTKAEPLAAVTRAEAPAAEEPPAQENQADEFFATLRETCGAAETAPAVLVSPPADEQDKAGSSAGARPEDDSIMEPAIELDEEELREQRVQQSLDIFYEQRSKRKTEVESAEPVGGGGTFASMLDDARHEAESERVNLVTWTDKLDTALKKSAQAAKFNFDVCAVNVSRVAGVEVSGEACRIRFSQLFNKKKGEKARPVPVPVPEKACAEPVATPQHTSASTAHIDSSNPATQTWTDLDELE
jgi:hypothetical protein